MCKFSTLSENGKCEKSRVQHLYQTDRKTDKQSELTYGLLTSEHNPREQMHVIIVIYRTVAYYIEQLYSMIVTIQNKWALYTVTVHLKYTIFFITVHNTERVETLTYNMTAVWSCEMRSGLSMVPGKNVTIFWRNIWNL